MTGLEAAPIVFVEVALAARALGGMRDRGAVRIVGVERWDGGRVVGFGFGFGFAVVAVGAGSLGAWAVVALEGLVSGTEAEVENGVGQVWMWMWDDGVSEAMVLAVMAHWKERGKGKGLYLG